MPNAPILLVTLVTRHRGPIHPSSPQFLAKNPDGKAPKKAQKLRRDREKKRPTAAAAVKEAAPDEVVESVRALEEMDVDEFMRSDAMMGVGDSDEEEDDEGGVAEEEGEGGEEEEEGEVEEDDGSGESDDEEEDDEEVAGLKNSVST